MHKADLSARGTMAVLLLLVVVGVPLTAQTSDQQAYELLNYAHIFGSGTSVRAAAELSIHEAGGRTSRGIEVFLERGGNGDSRMLAQVISPSFLRNLKYLTIREGRSSATWMKTSRGTRRLGSGGDDQAVFSSHFRSGDFSVVSPDEYGFAFVANDNPGRTSVEAVSIRNPEHRHVFDIDTQTNSYMAIRFYEANELVREYQVLELGEFDGITVPARARMDDYRLGGYTLLIVESYNPDARIPARVFNPAAL